MPPSPRPASEKKTAVVIPIDSRNPALRERFVVEQSDAHGRDSFFFELLLGGQDGLVNTLGVLLGLVATGTGRQVILGGGLAAAFAESVSMLAVGYTSVMANVERYQSEREREMRHIESAPNLERQEVVDIMSDKGFSGELLERVVDTICANKDVWVSLMLAEEHKLSPVTRADAIKSALMIFAAALLGSLVPILPIIVSSSDDAIYYSIAFSGIVLFLVGSWKARVMRLHSPTYAGFELLLIGLVSAAIGFSVALPFEADED